MIEPKLAMQAHRNYEMFKRAIATLTAREKILEKDVDDLYLVAKAQLYNINLDDFKDDMIGLEQEIDKIESLERKLTESQRQDYYASKGV